jgi:hypothetical protein
VREQKEAEEQERRKHATEEPVFRLDDQDTSPEAVGMSSRVLAAFVRACVRAWRLTGVCDAAMLFERHRDPSTMAHGLLAQYDNSAVIGDMERAFEICNMAIYFFDRLIEGEEPASLPSLRLRLGWCLANPEPGTRPRLAAENEQVTQKGTASITYLRWHLGLITAYANKGFSLRHLGYLSLAINSYTKAIQLHDQVGL